MAVKSFNRTVEVINGLLDKLDELPDYPCNFKGAVNNPSNLPTEPTEGDLYFVTYSDNGNSHLANYLYYRKASAWEIIATKSYTPYEIDGMYEQSARLYVVDNGETSAGTATVTLSAIDNGLYTVLVSSEVSSTEYGVSMYTLKKSTGSVELFTAISEVENAKISSISVSDGVATLTYDATGKHKIRFIGG